MVRVGVEVDEGAGLPVQATENTADIISTAIKNLCTVITHINNYIIVSIESNVKRRD
jgi:hypothetical protein